MLLFPFENMFCTLRFIFALVQFYTSLGKLNGMEMPSELLHADVNDEKSIDYARRMAFPLATSDNGVEMPPNVPNNMELNVPNGFGTKITEDNDDLEYDLPIKTEMPKWLQMQMQLQPESQQHNKYLHSAMLPKHITSDKHHHHHHYHDSRQLHNSVSSSATAAAAAAASPLKRCSIEISSKIPGICQEMGSIGNACVSGDYIDVFNSECL